MLHLLFWLLGTSRYCLEALVWSKHVRRRNRRDLRDLDLCGKPYEHPCMKCMGVHMASHRDLNPADPSVPVSNLYV